MALAMALFVALAPSVAGLVPATWGLPRAGRIVAMYRAPVRAAPPPGFTWGEDEVDQVKKVEALRKEGQLAVKARSERVKGYANWVAKAEVAAAAAAAKRLKDLQAEGKRVMQARADSQKGCATWVAKAEAAAAAAAVKRMKDLQEQGKRVMQARADRQKVCATWAAKAETA